MKTFSTQRLSVREQSQSQYIGVCEISSDGHSEICRTDSSDKAERVARALQLLARVEAGQVVVRDHGDEAAD